MKTSIIIPTWNTADITCRCILSIVKFLPKKFYEIIIVDNHSTDNTVLKIKKLKLKNLKLTTLDKNYGFSKANNIGAKNATGNYLFFLNSDMQFIDNSFLAMFKHILTNQNIGAIGPQFLNPDGTLQPSIFPPQTIKNAFKEFWLGQKGYSKYQPTATSPIKVWAISGGALLIKKETFFLINGWNEKYFFYYEDLDLCRKIRKINKSIVLYPQCKIIHYHGVSGKQITSGKNQWRRLIPSSKIYHGLFKHHLINFIIWTSQKWQRLLKT